MKTVEHRLGLVGVLGLSGTNRQASREHGRQDRYEKSRSENRSSWCRNHGWMEQAVKLCRDVAVAEIECRRERAGEAATCVPQPLRPATCGPAMSMLGQFLS